MPFRDVRRKIPGRLLEYDSYPGNLALEIWNYVLVIGISTSPPGHELDEPTSPNGYLLHYIRRGQLRHFVGGKAFNASRGNIALLDLGMGRRQRNDTSQTVYLWWIYFDGKSMPRVFSELRADRNPVFAGLNTGRIESCFRMLWKLITRKPVAYEAESHAMLGTILAEMFASRAHLMNPSNLLGRGKGLSASVRKGIDFLKQVHSKNIGLKHLEAAVGQNICHFSRKFRREVGMSPIQFLNRYRIEQAKPLLESSDKPIGEVASMVGIPDQNYFARLFGKLNGCSPQVFRKKRNDRKLDRRHRR